MPLYFAHPFIINNHFNEIITKQIINNLRDLLSYDCNLDIYYVKLCDEKIIFDRHAITVSKLQTIILTFNYLIV